MSGGGIAAANAPAGVSRAVAIGAGILWWRTPDEGLLSCLHGALMCACTEDDKAWLRYLCDTAYALYWDERRRVRHV